MKVITLPLIVRGNEGTSVIIEGTRERSPTARKNSCRTRVRSHSSLNASVGSQM